MTTPTKSLGRYELLELLGEGGMGAVWLARLSGTAGFEKLCIVKTVLPTLAKDADFVSRFLHEGRVLTQLAHGNIAQVLDMNEESGQLYLALEYVAGVDLSRLAEAVRSSNEYMPLSLVVSLVAQAAEGLGAAHRKTALDGSPLHVVHRDVSPQNIMVSYEGEVKVIDFGIAKSEARSRHTAQASVMGKLGYMAPEQAGGENVDHRADQYALGIVLWELLANRPFIPRGTLTEMVVAMANPVIRPLSPLRPDVGASLEAVVLKALAPMADARYPDTDAFARALTAEVMALGPPPTKPQLGEYVKTKCVQDYTVQRSLLTRISTARASGGAPLASDPLTATAMRPGPPLTTAPTNPSTQAPTIAARPVDPSAMTKPTAAGAAPRAGDVAGGTPVAAGAGSHDLGGGSPAGPRALGTAAPVPQGLDGSSAASSPQARELGSTAPVPHGLDAVSPAASGSQPRALGATASVSGAQPRELGATAPVPHGLDGSPAASRALGATSPHSLDVGASPGVTQSSGSSSAETQPRGVTSEVADALRRPLLGGTSEAAAPLTTEELEAAAVPRRSLGPLFIGAAVIALVIVGWAVTRGGDAEPAPVVELDAGVKQPEPPVAAVVEPVPPIVDAGAEVVAAPDPTPIPEPLPTVEAKPTLTVRARLASGTWIVANADGFPWKDCLVTVPGQKRTMLGTLAARSSRELKTGGFVKSDSAPKLLHQVRVDCAEGFGLAKVN